MPQVNISDDIYQRVIAFKPLVESVLEITLEQDPYFDLLLRLAPEYLMNEFFGAADAKALLALLQQLGQTHPDVYGAIAEVLEQNEVKAMESEKRSEVKQTLGFPEPAK